jgi:hypothetical protein
VPETTKQTTFRAIAYREGGEWIAHCLDLDIVSAEGSREGAVAALAEAMALQLAYAREHDNFAHLFRPAPEEAWQKLAEIVRGPHETSVLTIDDSDGGNSLLETQLAA